MAGVILVYLIILALILGFLWLLSPLIVEQGRTILAALPGYYQDIREWMVMHPNPLIVRLGFSLPLSPAILSPAPATEEEVIVSAGRLFGYISTTAHVIFIVLVLLALIFYWTMDGPRAIQSFLLLIPQERRENIRELISAIEGRLGSYILGQAVLCVVIGVMALLAYWWIGLPNALVLALIAGVFEAVPMVGPLLGAIPAGMVALSIAPDKFIWVILATIVIQQLENSLLVPRVMKSTVGVNPFVTLLALFAFGSFYGIPGALMAIPIAAIMQLLLDHFIFQPATMEPEVPGGRDYLSRLRYETQEFIQDLRKQVRTEKSGTDLEINQVDQVMDEIETITTDLDILLAEDDSAMDES